MEKSKSYSKALLGQADSDGRLGSRSCEPTVVQVARTAPQPVGNASQGRALDDLQKQRGDHLCPGIKALARKVGLVLADLLLEQISRKDADHLGENCNIAFARDAYFCSTNARCYFRLFFLPVSEMVLGGSGCKATNSQLSGFNLKKTIIEQQRKRHLCIK